MEYQTLTFSADVDVDDDKSFLGKTFALGFFGSLLNNFPT